MYEGLMFPRDGRQVPGIRGIPARLLTATRSMRWGRAPHACHFRHASARPWDARRPSRRLSRLAEAVSEMSWPAIRWPTHGVRSGRRGRDRPVLRAAVERTRAPSVEHEPMLAVREGYGYRVQVFTEASDARSLAFRLVGGTSDRWQHVVGVAAAAQAASSAVQADEASLLVAAAWLHDIGYSPGLATTGFHPLDGARHLRVLGAPARLCALVAHHSAASVEAKLRGLGPVLSMEFPADRSVVADALTYADMTTGPSGQSVVVEDRLAEILTRYPAGHPVHEAISIASPQIIAAVTSVEIRLAARRPRCR
ncbi:HD domain-containing protein [Georgenia wangjunii]|uniref:HD domain-containing protein n=1 Tax=Georgenia wangjunii TaxID=3117730 RepID=UPI003D9C5091